MSPTNAHPPPFSSRPPSLYRPFSGLDSYTQQTELGVSAQEASREVSPVPLSPSRTEPLSSPVEVTRLGRDHHGNNKKRPPPNFLLDPSSVLSKALGEGRSKPPVGDDTSAVDNYWHQLAADAEWRQRDSHVQRKVEER
jgi:hypothetical protein